VRARLAQAWFTRPDAIDPEEDADAIGVQLQLWELENQFKPKTAPPQQ